MEGGLRFKMFYELKKLSAILLDPDECNQTVKLLDLRLEPGAQPDIWQLYGARENY